MFTVELDRLKDEVRQESPLTVMFADDLCSVECRKQVEESPERCRDSLERRGAKVRRSK